MASPPPASGPTSTPGSVTDPARLATPGTPAVAIPTAAGPHPLQQPLETLLTLREEASAPGASSVVPRASLLNGGLVDTADASSLLSGNGQPLSSSLAHLAVTSTPTCAASPPDTTSILALLVTPGSVSTIGVHPPRAFVCDTGEPLSAKLLQALRSLDFVELHEFLPAPLL